MDLEKLLNNSDWEAALIIFAKDNWNIDYTEEERTYRVSVNSKYFQHDKIGTSLFGNCLDGKDNGVRLDLYNWKVEKIIIEQ